MADVPRVKPEQVRVLCPLRFEQTQLRKKLQRLRIECCGPGAVAVQSWIEANATADGALILAGVAGSLSRRHPPGTAWWVTGVRQSSGEIVEPTLPLVEWGHLSECIATSVNRPVTSSCAKRELAARAGAHLVDLESESFATAASKAGTPWAIVRGVSDGMDDELPSRVEDLVDEQGRARLGMIALAVLRHPGLAKDLRHLGQSSRLAMERVAEMVQAAWTAAVNTRV